MAVGTAAAGENSVEISGGIHDQRGWVGAAGGAVEGVQNGFFVGPGHGGESESEESESGLEEARERALGTRTRENHGNHSFYVPCYVPCGGLRQAVACGTWARYPGCKLLA